MQRTARPLLFSAWLLLAILWLTALPARAEEAAYPSGIRWIDPAGVRGSLVLSGGGVVPGEVRDKFVALAGGKEARIVVISTASPEANEISADPLRTESLLESWKARGVAEVTLLHTTDRNRASDEAFVAPLKKATGVWFIGGKQTVLAASYLGTAVEREILSVCERGGVVGGTSAGAAILTKVMTYGDRETRTATGFDLLPGATVVTHFVSRRRQERLRTTLQAQPGLVGIGLDDGGALVVQGRKLEVLGQPPVSIYLGPSASRPARELALKPGEIHDLTMLRRAALERTLPEFPSPKPAPARLESGSLVIVGGGGLGKEIVKKFIELAGGPEAPIVVLPIASADVLPPNYAGGKTPFLEAGSQRVTVLSHRTKAEVESPEFTAALAEAKGVWFGGGRQWRFVDAYAGTKAETLLHNVLRRGGVIGGSSAGASIQSQYMVRGSVLGNIEPMAEGYERGLSFLPGAAIDQHFTQRKRQPDMSLVMRRYPQLLGIGIDEGTALVVRGHTAEVLGPARVHFYDYQSGPPAGEQDYQSVAAGGKYDLVERRVLDK